MFNRFKEKLAGFKEALSTKVIEKVGAKLENHVPNEPPADDGVAQKAEMTQQTVLEPPKAEIQTAKPKNKFSFLEKAKSLVFEQEVILEEKDLEEPLWALEMALLESDVALPVAEEIVKEVKSDLVGAKKKIGADTGRLAEDALRNALVNLLSRNHLDFDEYIAKAEKPVKILFVGVNGTGKTTSIAKVARYLMDRDYSVVLAAGDTFRAGAIEQLEVHGDNLGLKVVKHKTGG
ncbi:MAG TPA: signal recognition particle receptor subunit alpha, partial [Methanothrix sp.]|nr:signal recognition particle receptor subunit alpha [Methanothrix sp.]